MEKIFILLGVSNEKRNGYLQRGEAARATAKYFKQTKKEGRQMIYFSLYVDGYIDGNYNYDYFNFDRENWEDILKMINGLKNFYPFKLENMSVVVYSHFCLHFRKSNTIRLSTFDVTFDNENKPIFTYRRELT